MAKELPYFKFDCAEYLTGDISMEDYYVQGLFTNICAYYWKNDCNITMAKLRRRYATAIEPHFDTLVEQNIIKVDEYDNVRILFLDEQLQEIQVEKKKKSSAGKSGAYARWHPHTSANATAMAKHGNKEVEVEVDKDIKIYRKFKHLSITENEFQKLLEAGYSSKDIDSTIDDIENYAKNKSYTSLYLTCRKWLKKKKNNYKSTSNAPKGYGVGWNIPKDR